MKQPIAGIAGLKPRISAPKPDGKLSKEEARLLDREYRERRNETLRLKNHLEAMLLAKARGELILRDLVEKQAAYLSIAMRQRMLAVPQAYAGRLVGLADPHAVSQVLRAAMIECLNELKDLPAKVTDASGLNGSRRSKRPAPSPRSRRKFVPARRPKRPAVGTGGVCRQPPETFCATMRATGF